MLKDKTRFTPAPRQDARRSRWMGSEAAFMRIRAAVLIPSEKTSKASRGAKMPEPIGIDQLMRVCRKSGSKSKG